MALEIEAQEPKIRNRTMSIEVLTAANKPTLLCVDDEIENVDTLERLLRKRYNVLKATSGKAGLELLKQNQNISVIISDQRMPTMTGVEFLAKSQQLQPDATRILLTGYTDIESVIAAVNDGQIYRYVTKPWDPREFAITVDRASERFELNNQLKQKNRELTEAYESLKKLDDAKNNFMILIGHELKTPLTSLLSYSELLMESRLNEEQKHLLGRVEKSGNRLKEIIFDVLDLTAAELGTMPFYPKQSAIKPVIDAVTTQLAPELKKKNQTFDFKISNTDVCMDEKMITDVLRRIIHNAIKFGESDSKIELSTAKQDSALVITVRNSGPTLSPDVIERILKPFAIDENIMNHSQGLGLGLSLSRALLSRHGSQLKIMSENKKTNVSFTLKT